MSDTAKVKTYYCGDEQMEVDPDGAGGWVRADDYESLERENAALREECDRKLSPEIYRGLMVDMRVLREALEAGMNAITELVGAHGEISTWPEWDDCSRFVHDNSALTEPRFQMIGGVMCDTHWVCRVEPAENAPVGGQLHPECGGQQPHTEGGGP